MNRSKIRRVFGVVIGTMLMVAMLGVAAADAKGPIGAGNPKWRITVTPLPSRVQPGNDAGYLAIVENYGTSNIIDLTLKVNVVDAESQQTSYFSGLQNMNGTPYGVSCTDGGPLTCPLGTFVAGSKLKFTIAYLTPDNATSFSVKFSLAAGTGDTGSDGNGSSRGDSYAVVGNTTMVSNGNFDGGFVTGADVYDTVGNLGRQNKQNSSLDVSDDNLPATVEDGSGVQDGNTCTIDECFGAKVGEWTRIDVPEHSGMIQVTMFIWGGNVDGGVQPDGVYALHDPDGAAGAYPIKDICTSDAPTSECVVATKVGNNWKLVVWLKDNGGLRGGY